jgi:hypothetical protein
MKAAAAIDYRELARKRVPDWGKRDVGSSPSFNQTFPGGES